MSDEIVKMDKSHRAAVFDGLIRKEQGRIADKLPEGSQVTFTIKDDQYSNYISVQWHDDVAKAAGYSHGNRMMWQCHIYGNDEDDKVLISNSMLATMRESRRHLLNLLAIERYLDSGTNHRQAAIQFPEVELPGIGYDRVFINHAALHGVSLETIHNAICEHVRACAAEQGWIYGHMSSQALQEVVRNNSIANQPKRELSQSLRKIYGKAKVLEGAMTRLPAFTGNIDGKKPLAIDFRLGQWTYNSSHTPTLTSDHALSETLRSGLKGRLVNEIMDEPLFGPDQRIIHVHAYNNGTTGITITPDIVGLEEIRGSWEQAA